MSGMPEASEPPPVASNPPSNWLVASGNFFFRVRNGLFPAVFVLVLLFVRPEQFLGSRELDGIVMAAGMLVAMLGQGFRLLVIGYAYIERGGRNRQVYASKLVVAGLYAHSRNPMYVGNFMIACGVSMVFGSPWLYFLVVPFFAYVYAAIVAAEERYLLGKFGADYEAYRSQVNRYLPDLRGLHATLRGHRFQWKKALSKEHGTLFATCVGLVGVTIWKMYWIQGWDAARTDILQRSWVFLPLVIAYGIVRLLKRTGRLKESNGGAV